ncbi:phage tail protein [Asticcacaulis machinosus]|uniref:Phage tail protein n=1 Tax=Asticcacaulis machinosus TaxID=2984211 RepID=A0ABT5HGL3_9CAUL|nr:phage tail protein [Asticcacaulis machinosus]MDC7675392.1 phage tail protein [Asticcacaulis machinosus]
MMMALGSFIFELASLPYQELQRQTAYRHATTDRFGARPAAQYLGEGDDTITLTGALVGGGLGRFASMDEIRDLAATGDAYTLVSGSGDVLGEWYIANIAQNDSTFMKDGKPRKADFTILLKRDDDPLPPISEARA